LAKFTLAGNNGVINSFMSKLLPISAIVPTRHRSVPFGRMLHSLAQQSVQPMEMIVVDGSSDDNTRNLCQSKIPGLATQIHYHRATEIGAATQRNQAMTHAMLSVIWLLDDDILFEPECLARLWAALESDSLLGGVNAMITNQRYSTPGRVSRLLFAFLNGRAENSYAGKCIGPALNLLPEDNSNLPEVVSVEWLNSTCTLYRRQALPHPLFSSIFTGYSLMEDLTLSLIVGKKWKLANARTARIFHDSQPGDHKNNVTALAQMELVNRHYVMTKILHRQHLEDYFKLFVLQIYEIMATSISAKHSLFQLLLGKWRGLKEIFNQKN
jgi:glycosyltransferase involved in cell wall biosynthesis